MAYQQQLGSATLTTFSHHLRDLWNSPRGAVLRIEALTLVAITLSFFISAFGSCRRWSNQWILQKGFIAANGLFLSLGIYSIGLMQSSSVKSDMYPIWTVSLLGFLCYIDPITTASGPDNKTALWKMLYQLCLYCGYVMLMTISTISSDIGNVAICLLSAVTFMKGFHRSMALMLPSSMRNMIRDIPEERAQFYFRYPNDVAKLIVDMPLDVVGHRTSVYMGDVSTRRGEDNDLTSNLDACKDVCFSFSLSHLLQRRFLLIKEGDDDEDVLPMQMGEILIGNFEQVFKAVDVELAFLYDIFFTSNAFLHYYEAKAASIWAFPSVIGICFVGVVAAIPGTRTNRHASPGTIIVDTTIADIIITEVILLSLALLTVFQLLCCWTSNWARVSFACDYVRNPQVKGIRRRMRQLKASLIKINLSDNYLWQNKLGQHSIIESASMGCCRQCCVFMKIFIIAPICSVCSVMLGLHYIGQVLREMLCDSNTGNAVELHADVKASIADFIGGLDSNEASRWASDLGSLEDTLKWHVATCYCELAQEHDDKGFLKCTDSEKAVAEKHHRVAMALSKYCAYLLVSAPRLLNESVESMKIVYNEVRQEVFTALRGKDDKLGAMELFTRVHGSTHTIFCSGVELGMGLRSQPTPVRWKAMAEFWVKTLVYNAPSCNNTEEHVQHLLQGGELITHLWALLYHAGIDLWHYNEPEWWGQWDANNFQGRPGKDHVHSLEPTQGLRIHAGDSPDLNTYAQQDGASSSQQPLSP
ncbi:uncharacterized protein [Miscanthus floridulus]|uniref:uncharacterized protein n=1 Tax=Miscanthus floridulus TaxID=154761 RepID=UPI00345B11F4